MSETLWLISAIILSTCGMAWLALAMEVHWTQSTQRPAEQTVIWRRCLRAAGAIALVLSLLACLNADRPSMAALVWIMLLTGSAIAVGFTLTWRPYWLSLLAATTPANRK